MRRRSAGSPSESRHGARAQYRPRARQPRAGAARPCGDARDGRDRRVGRRRKSRGIRARRRGDGRGGGCGQGAGAFRPLARTVGLDLNTSAAAPGLTPEKLAAAMAAPENASMRKSTKRVVADADLLPLARLTLALK